MRVFTERERVQFERKPDSLERLRGVAMADARVFALLRDSAPVRFGYSLGALETAIAAARASGDARCEFLAVSASGAVFAVNTEGASYARYCAAVRDAESGAVILATLYPPRLPAPAGWRYLADVRGAADAFAGASDGALYSERGELALIADREGEGEYRAEAYLGEYGYGVTVGTREAALTLLGALADALEAESERDGGDFTRAAARVGFGEVCSPSGDSR